MALDPIKYETFYQKLDKAVNEGKEIVRYLSAGVITREAGEVQEAIYLPNGEAALIASGILMHIMNVTRVVRYMNANQYAAKDIGIYEGDQFINNDAYIGGMHNPDTGCVAPLFHEGKLIGYVAAISHTTEIGSIEVGGMSPSAVEAVHDGIHLPAVKLVERGLMRRDVMGLILRAVRDQTSAELDIRARLAGNDKTMKLVAELIEEFGLPFFEEALERLVDDAEAFARDRIRTLRPGVYRARAYDENSGLREKLAMMEVELEVTEAGDLIVRLPVVSPENRSYNNAYLPAVEATVFYYTLELLLYDCRWNSGLARAIKIADVPAGSRLNASPNASVGYATVGISTVFGDAFSVCLSRALYSAGRLNDVVGPSTCGNGTIAGGTNQYGDISVHVIMSHGTPRATGARIDKDGIDSSVTMYNPWTFISDVESEETLLPIIHLFRAHRPDSGGFGKFRGGTGVESLTMVYGSDSISMNHYGAGKRIASNQGMFGGYPGPAAFFDWMPESNIAEVIADGGEIPRSSGTALSEYFKGECITGQISVTSGERMLKTGAMFYNTTNGGGGGLGDPIERDPELIVKDVINKMATLEIAQKAYSVAINPETLEIDRQKTTQLRAERRKERLQRGIPGADYLGQLVKAREERRLPGAALDLIDETKSFSPHFGAELEQEKKLAAAGLKPIGKFKVVKKLLGLTPYVDIVEDEQGRKLAVCSNCGFGYCEATDNFKYYCLIHEREPAHFHSGRLAYDKDWCVFREFYCPSCAAQIEVETIAPGAPILRDYQLKF